MIENLEEGWVKFQRCECKSGFIDIWTGSTTDDPNSEYENQQKLGIHKMYRLNGNGLWIKDDQPRQSLFNLLIIMRDKCSAEEIWSIAFPH